MTAMLQGVLFACWRILAEAAPFVLLGFFAAGLLRALVPVEAVARHLGPKSFGAVLKASLFGIPLPLCSCGVIPAAVGLRRQGASKGAAAAFLVSVPETGVDSIAITWALLDPVMTVARPLAAFLTATVTGLLINRLPEEPVAGDAGSDAGCGCAGGGEEKLPLWARLRAGLAYAFGDLLADIGRWLLLGIVLAGVITYFVPASLFSGPLGQGGASLLLMLVVGIPLYICASASTPIAAALVLKGLSPGAALVFLLAGPATNAANLAVVGRFWGRRATAVYLAAIAGCSLALGWLTNRFYAWSGLDIGRWVARPAETGGGLWEGLAAVLLLLLLARAFFPRSAPEDESCSPAPGGG